MKTSKVLENNIDNVGFWSGIFNAFKDFFNNGDNKNDSYIASEVAKVEENLSARANSLLKMIDEPTEKTVSKRKSRIKTEKIELDRYSPQVKKSLNKNNKEINIDNSEKVQEK